VTRPKPLGTTGRIVLLGAQALTLGVLVAWITVPASAIFVEQYGSARLPWTYVGAGAAGALASAGLSVALRRRPLVWVVMRVLAAAAVLLGVAYVGLVTSGAWVSAPLLVVLPIVIPIGFMFVVGQAGEMLDVRVLKVSYARVVAGFALGFVGGGLTASPIMQAVGQTEVLLVGAAVATALFAALVRVGHQLVPALDGPVPVSPGVESRRAPSIGTLLRDRFILLITAYQFLSAIETQWLEYLVYERAARRYPSSAEMADFIGRVMAISYGSDLLFLLVVAGFLIRRFGVRGGLTGYAVGVLAVLGAATVAAGALGVGATPAFVLLVAARVTDLTLCDGAGRPALGAAYQAIPTRERLAAQAMVEGLAVPLAIGLAGVVLIVLNAVTGTSGLLLPILTLVLVVAWVAVAFGTFRGYRVNLLANLAHRTLDPADLAIDDATTLAAVERLLDSADARDVRLGVYALQAARHPHLVDRLGRLVADDRVGVRSIALDVLRAEAPKQAAAAARAGLDHPDPAIRAASVTALGHTGDSAIVPAVLRHWNDRDDAVRLAAATVVARLGDANRTDHISADLRHMADSPDARERRLAAEVLAIEAATGLRRTALAALLDDRDDGVATAALGAVQWEYDAALLDQAIAHLDRPATAAAAVEALARSGPLAVGAIEAVLVGSTGSQAAPRHAARTCRLIGGDAGVGVLARHLDHADRDLAAEVARQLAVAEAARADCSPAVRTDVLARAAEALGLAVQHAAHVMRALVVLGSEPHATLVGRALADEFDLVQYRVAQVLAIRYGAEGVDRARFQFSQPDPRLHALAMEWLDVTLVGDDRAGMVVLDPALSPAARLERLVRETRLGRATASEVLDDLLADPERRWRRPWLAACALLTEVQRGEQSVLAAVSDGGEGAPWRPPGASEATILDETFLGLHRRLAATGG